MEANKWNTNYMKIAYDVQVLINISLPIQAATKTPTAI